LGDTGELSVGAERRLGERIARELLRDPDFLDDPVLGDYVERLWLPLLAAARQRGELVPDMDERFAWRILLGRDRSINAFALPGGQVFITESLFRSLTNEGQLAGILGHEIGHVLERHGAERISQNQLLQGLAGAAGVAGGDINSARMAQMIAGLVSMKYGRSDELESDRWGVELVTLAGYDPEHMIEVMDILERAGGSAPPDILSTHPSPANRREYINRIIAEKFPYGKPEGLR
jgi:predicted Zn-dependent protease